MMYLITIQDKSRGTITCSCDSENIHSMLNLLENSPLVNAYKLVADNIGLLTIENLKYSFTGWTFPNGKAVEKFDWKT